MADQALVRLPAGRLWLLRVVLVVVTAAVTLTVMRLLDSPVADVQRLADTDGLTGTVLPSPYSLRDATLTDTTGAPVALRDGLEAPVTLLFFGYTRCDDVCSTVLSNITSARVGAFLERFDPGFTGLTGPLDTLMATASSVRVAMQAGRKLPSGVPDLGAAS